MVYDKISQLLLEQWSSIEPFIKGKAFESVQKTYKEGVLKSGRDTINDLVVVYEADNDAGSKDKKTEDALFGWLSFGDVNQLKLKIVNSIEMDDDGKPSPPNLILMFPEKEDFNLNEILGTLDLNEIGLKDNVSQFLKLDKNKTNISRTKLSDNIDTEFSELSPVTFTHFLEKYNKLKKQIPLRYRSDDFFEEYSNSQLPFDYRIEKLFEEFERMKTSITPGKLTPYINSAGERLTPQLDDFTDEQLFGWQTLTYLVSQAQTIIGTTNPIFSQEDARTWMNEIDYLDEDNIRLNAEISSSLDKIQELEDYIANLTGSLDETYEEEFIEPALGVNISVLGSSTNNPANRKLIIDGEEFYSDNSNGLRVSVYTENSIRDWANSKLGLSPGEYAVGGGTANGNGSGQNTNSSLPSPIFDETYNLVSEDSQNTMARDILGGNWNMNDIFIVSSFGKVYYSDLLVKALKSIGGCYPQGASGVGDTDITDQSKTPYALIGSLGKGQCGGYEAVGDDGPDSRPSEVSKFWNFNVKNEGGFGTDAPEPVYGCTDLDANNYQSYANEDDGSCTYDEAGCMRTDALNWDKVRNPQFDFCKSETGFVSETKCTQDSECVTQHGTGWTCDGSCEYEDSGLSGPEGCTVPEAWNYNPMAVVDDGSCGCFETLKFKDLPPPYDEACQPGPEHPGTQNMNNCSCEYPNISVTWSRKSSDCHDYNFWNTDAKCKCTCKSNKPSLVADKSWSDLGDCAVSFENDDTNCKNKCNAKCASLSTSVSGYPVCDSGTTWNGSFCSAEMAAGGPVPSSKNINEGASTEINSDILSFGVQLDLPKENLKTNYRRGGRTKPKPKFRPRRKK